MKIEDDIIYSYILYLNGYSFRESMIDTAFKTLNRGQEATSEHYLVCGVVNESNAELRDLYIEMARSYSIALPKWDSAYCKEWRVLQEFRLAKLGFAFPEKPIDIMIGEYELVCIYLICHSPEGGSRYEGLERIYASRTSSYEMYLGQLDAMARAVDEGSTLGRSFQRLVSFINGYAYGGVGSEELREISEILESLM